eukprot:g11845.t1
MRQQVTRRQMKKKEEAPPPEQPNLPQATPHAPLIPIGRAVSSHRSCVAKALCAHLTSIAVANVIVWTIYFLVWNSSYPWPMWVTFGTLLSVAGHAVNVLPWTQSATPRGPARCPRWLQTVLGNIVLVNVSVWVVYFFTSCAFHCGYYWPPGTRCNTLHCGYVWPVWVSVPSCFAALVVSAVARACHKPEVGISRGVP